MHHDICTGCGGLQKPLHSLNLALDWVRFVPTTQSPTAIDSRDYLIGPLTLLLVVSNLMAQGVGPALVFEFKYVVCGGFFRIFTRFFNVSLRLGAQAFQALFGFWGCG